jgi:ribose transport system substrate-binding protein
MMIDRRRMPVKYLAYLMTVTVLGLSTFACSEESGDGTLTIAVIPKGTTHEFWKSVHAGAVKASRELDVQILWQGPLKEDDREEQIKVVDSFKARRVSGIALAPLDDKALRLPVRNATRAGIPVLVFDSALDSDDTVSFVSTDNYQGGRVGGEYLARILGGSGKVALLRMQEGSASTMKREQGFLDAIGEHDDIEIISSNQYGGVTTETSFRASENLLAALGAASGGVDGIFCPNESTTFGMLRALQDAQLAGKIKLVGFDSSTQLVAAMSAGELHGLVLQDPFNMGYLSVKMLVEHLRGAKIEDRIDTGLTLVTPENMNEPEIREHLLPDLDAYLN